MTISEMKDLLKDEMTINGILSDRYHHSLMVATKAIELSKKHNLPLEEETVYIAGLLHDCAKLMPKSKQREILINLGYNENEDFFNSPSVWHSYVGAWYAKTKYQITDERILNSIKNHVMGKPLMTHLEMLIFVADYVEDSRIGQTFVEARDLANYDLEKATVFILKSTIDYLNSKNYYVVKQTKETYEYYKGEK